MTEKFPINSNIKNNSNFLIEYNFDSLHRIPFYFGSEDNSLLGWLHTTDPQREFKDGIVLCPPLAVEYMNSYRSLRYTADYFALSGIPALRFDYHGTGDSSGTEEDDNRLDEWLSSIGQAIDTIKHLSKCSSVSLFGFRMGATLAALAAQKHKIKFLILWAPLTNGRKYIREIKLIQKTSAIQAYNESDLILEAGGMRYWDKTSTDISTINLSKIKPRAKHILIIPRDEQSTDTELFDSWEKIGLNVDRKCLEGSTMMLVDPHHTIVPHKTIQNIVQWVEHANLTKKNDFTVINQSLVLPTKAELVFPNITSKIKDKSSTKITESMVYLDENNKIFGILSEPVTANKTTLPIVILPNSGANHRVGPSRLYVTIARELSSLGFTCLRLDMPGIGDSNPLPQDEENTEYVSTSNEVILNAIKKIQPSYQDKNFILMGLCSGAYFSFQAALKLKKLKINECILINPLTFYWDGDSSEDNSPTKEFRIWNWYKKAITSKHSWKKLIKGQIDFKSLISAIKNRLQTKITSKYRYELSTVKNKNKHKQQLSRDLASIADNGTKLQFLLSRSDPGYDILMTHAGRTVKKLQKNNSLKINFVENADHTFSKYSPRCDLINKISHHFKLKAKDECK